MFINNWCNYQHASRFIIVIRYNLWRLQFNWINLNGNSDDSLHSHLLLRFLQGDGHNDSNVNGYHWRLLTFCQLLLAVESCLFTSPLSNLKCVVKEEIFPVFFLSYTRLYTCTFLLLWFIWRLSPLITIWLPI